MIFEVEPDDIDMFMDGDIKMEWTRGWERKVRQGGVGRRVIEIKCKQTGGLELIMKQVKSAIGIEKLVEFD